VVIIAESLAASAPSDSSAKIPARVHSVLKGKELLGDTPIVALPADSSLPTGSLLILFGEDDGESGAEARDWEWIAADEAVIGYVAGSPSLRVEAPRRLAYFARYLDHGNLTVAEDAYLEFAHAPYDVVQGAAGHLPMAAIRQWIVDPAVPAQRKGFYGLALGLSVDDEKTANAQLLRRLILEPAGDFRGGFDGILAGYLLAAGETALELIEERILANPDSAEGDVRHAMNALRFYHESGRQIPAARLCEALEHLLKRPEFAAPAIVDLARWQDWEAAERIVGLYDAPPSQHQSSVRRAIIGYLLVCPTPAAAAHLRTLRQRDPDLVEEVQRRPVLPSRRE